MKYTSNMFESIKEALNKKTTSSSEAFKDFLKLEIGKTYVVRLVPNLKQSADTIFHYYSHIWNSTLTQEIISVFCPTSYKERCPIDEHRSKIYKQYDGQQDHPEIKKIKPIKRNENWLVNVYVVNDPSNPENEGKVKILRMGKQLFNIVGEAMQGDDAKDFGERIFDLSENGCNLRIKVEKNDGGYPSYVKSRFLTSSPLDEDDTDSIYSAIKPLNNIFERKSYEDIQKLLQVHFLGESPINKESNQETYEDSNFDDSSRKTINTSIKSKQTTSKNQDEDETDPDDRINDILKDLSDI